MFSNYDSSNVARALINALNAAKSLAEAKTDESMARTRLTNAQFIEQDYRNDNMRGYREYRTTTNQ